MVNFYFDNLIENIKKTNDREKLLKNFINPVSGYYLCDHFVGIEIHKDYPYIPIKIEEYKNDLLKTKNLSLINDYDIIYVEINYFDLFLEQILNKINKKIVLVTGQWYGPQIFRNNKSDYVLNHKNILLWVSQNPIYVNSINYFPIPYGIAPFAVEVYSNVLLETYNNLKIKNITHLPLNPNTNECRKKLPFLKDIPIKEFYEETAKAKYLISPIGDRDDCYRHTECIGLGTIPISNVDHLHKQLFKNNMHYSNIDDMVDFLNKNEIDSKCIINKNFISFDYHKNLIFEKIEMLK